MIKRELLYHRPHATRISRFAIWTSWIGPWISEFFLNIQTLWKSVSSLLTQYMEFPLFFFNFQHYNKCRCTTETSTLQTTSNKCCHFTRNFTDIIRTYALLAEIAWPTTADWSSVSTCRSFPASIRDDPWLHAKVGNNKKNDKMSIFETTSHPIRCKVWRRCSGCNGFWFLKNYFIFYYKTPVN
jgi:hypothetical protein